MLDRTTTEDTRHCSNRDPTECFSYHTSYRLRIPSMRLRVERSVGVARTPPPPPPFYLKRCRLSQSTDAPGPGGGEDCLVMVI